ncbi:MAG: universal stress protein, partial [Thermoleophilia bacterium]|nr:universal stress protein [Thermoleophilia bacterium]
METVVVGVDGSAGSLAALEFAAKEAGLRNGRLRVVSAWEIPPAVLAGVVTGPGFYEGFREAAQTVANDAAKQAANYAPHVPCEIRVVEGQAADAIVRQAGDAALIVVGRRGHGGFAGLLLGSVSHQVVNHAPCPVVVVPVPAKK